MEAQSRQQSASVSVEADGGSEAAAGVSCSLRAILFKKGFQSQHSNQPTAIRMQSESEREKETDGERMTERKSLEKGFFPQSSKVSQVWLSQP